MTLLGRLSSLPRDSSPDGWRGGCGGRKGRKETLWPFYFSLFLRDETISGGKHYYCSYTFKLLFHFLKKILISSSYVGFKTVDSITLFICLWKIRIMINGEFFDFWWRFWWDTLEIPGVFFLNNADQPIIQTLFNLFAVYNWKSDLFILFYKSKSTFHLRFWDRVLDVKAPVDLQTLRKSRLSRQLAAEDFLTPFLHLVRPWAGGLNGLVVRPENESSPQYYVFQYSIHGWMLHGFTGE